MKDWEKVINGQLALCEEDDEEPVVQGAQGKKNPKKLDLECVILYTGMEDKFKISFVTKPQKPLNDTSVTGIGKTYFLCFLVL